jgi:dihydropteroate synthase
LAEGLPKEDLVMDPGLGFAKNARHSLELCARLEELVALGFPVLVGPSRKSFLARAAGRDGAPLAPPDRRLGAGIAAMLACVSHGAAIVRVHDVEPARQALAFAEASAQLGRDRRTQGSVAGRVDPPVRREAATDA